MSARDELRRLIEANRNGTLTASSVLWDFAGATLARMDESTPEQAGTKSAEPSENRELRRMLCIAHCGLTAYMDDGEAQDNSVTPFIDFLRDPLNTIKASLHERNKEAFMTALKPSPEPAVAEPSHNTDAMHDSAYLAGLNLGFTLGLNNDVATVEKIATARRDQIAALKRSAP